MIHTLLALTRPLIVPDTETTGLDPQTSRICELGFQLWNGVQTCRTCEGIGAVLKEGETISLNAPGSCKDCEGTGKRSGLIKEWRMLINPQVPIPLSATKIHGITDTAVKGCRVCGEPEHMETDHAFAPWPVFKQIASNLARGFTECDYAGKNIRFDLRILAAEMSRAGVVWSYAGARIVDIDRLEAIAIPRSLAHLHEKYTGAKHDGAHGALSDVRASVTVLVKQFETHTEVLPRDLDALHALQWPNFIDEDGKFRYVNGVPTVMFGKYRDKPMRTVPTDYWDFMLKSDFSAELKALASAAKLGKFPEPKA